MEAASGGFGSGGFNFGPGSGGLEFRLANGIPELRKITGDLGLLCNFILLQGPVCKMGIVLFISLIYLPLRKNKKSFESSAFYRRERRVHHVYGMYHTYNEHSEERY